MKSHTIATPEAHTFKVWMVDPAVVVQKILVDCGGLKPSFDDATGVPRV